METQVIFAREKYYTLSDTMLKYRLSRKKLQNILDKYQPEVITNVIDYNTYKITANYFKKEEIEDIMLRENIPTERPLYK